MIPHGNTGPRAFKKRQKIYLALEELNFVWCEAEVSQVIDLWEQGLNIWDISKAMKRDPDEVTILIMDLARKERIIPRPVEAVGRRRRGDANA